jgi:rhamnose utilization protein RhaD (predicted bifunctional aldolase and dehydrogenase)/NAD(P)-dependent dehydrogenase (short-subunit alcohol dehydrogenase family)
MHSLWNDEEARTFPGELRQRIYTSRLLGREKSLVLHGGGNTSVKIRERDVFGELQTVLYVKASGWDLETIEAQGFAPVRLDHAVRLASLEALSDAEMVNQLATIMRRAGAPDPSVETLLHACLPFKYVDHTHSDAVLAISATHGGEARMRDVYGERCVIIPYRMPGFDLARYCAGAFAKETSPRTIGMVLLNHGLFSFGEHARESYERMVDLVSLAEAYLERKRAWDVVPRKAAVAPAGVPTVAEPLAQSQLRRMISDAAGAPMIMKTGTSEKALAFARHPSLARISQQGPITADHVSRTKRIPMLGTDVGRFVDDYRRYFDAHAPGARQPKSMIDPAPRVALDPSFGMASVGKTASDAAIVEELYEHTIDTILRAEALGGYLALPAKDVFDVEYWDLQQAKLARGGKPALFTGEIVLVTGAASGIGRAAVSSFLSRGAAVVGFDLSPAVETLHARIDYLGLRCDVTDEPGVGAALRQAVLQFGGIDMLVLNAGIFPASRKIAELGSDEWRRVMSVNLDANQRLLRLTHPYLKLALRGGRVTVIGSKNVPAPGPGAAAYSASKAALNQLVRVAALEWGADAIRINTIHPNAVFDTGIWTAEVLAQRARHYGMTVEDYKKNNVLRTEVTSHDVAELAAEMCGPLFAKTTGAQVPVDGGNERVI